MELIEIRMRTLELAVDVGRIHEWELRDVVQAAFVFNRFLTTQERDDHRLKGAVSRCARLFEGVRT